MENTSAESTGVFGFVDTLVNSAYSTLTTIFSSFGFMEDVISASTGPGGMLGIPAWVGTGLITMTLLIIVFGIYSLLFKSDT